MENQHNKNISPQLLKYRTEIDTIDQEIIDLLDKRIEIVKNVGKYKASKQDKFFIKSAREADMIRNLIKKTDQKIHKATIFLIWRKIITYANILEQNITIGLLNSENDPHHQHYIKEYYNDFIDIKNYDNNNNLILDINKNKIQLAIFPAKNKSWWIDLAQQDNKFNIFAKIPFIKHKENNKDSELFIAAIKEPEKSYNDKTLLIIISENKAIEIEEIFSQKNIEFKILQEEVKKNNNYFLIQINDFYNQNDQLISDLNNNTKINKINIIGHYPTEINI